MADGSLFTAGYAQNADIKRIRVDGSSLSTVAAWPNIQDAPVYSPDGKRIAFRSRATPEGIDNGDKIMHSSLTGQDVVQVVPTEPIAALRPAWGRNGRIAFEAQGWDGVATWSAIMTAAVDGTDLRSLVRTTELSPSVGWLGNPDFSADGLKVVYERGNNACIEIYVLALTGAPAGSLGNKIGCGQGTGYSPFDAQAHHEALLATYAPDLHYNQGETFFADAAETMTNTIGAGGANALKRPGTRLATLASSTGAKTCSKLVLSYLGSAYGPTNTCGSQVAGDFLDIANSGDSYSADYQRIVSQYPQYTNTTYGRAVQDSTGSWWLQYWLFYYHNPFEVVGIGVHEGDWEMMQMRLTEAGPDQLTFATHNGGMKCAATGMSWNGTHPSVFVARGSHASYPNRGQTEVTPTAGTDHHHGDGRVTRPSVTLINESTKWLGWDGRWGGSNASPTGPRYKSQWADPAGWHNQQSNGPCGFVLTPAATNNVSLSARGSGPKLRVKRLLDHRVTDNPPSLTAVSVGRSLRVSYDIPETVKLGKRKMLISVNPDDGKHYVPTNTWVPARRHGTVTVSRPVGGEERVRISARVYSRAKEVTGLTVIRLRR